MTLKLSVLDPSPLLPGQTSGEALEATLCLAESAERWGYSRFWVQEHHNTPTFAGVAPEVTLGALSQRTRKIRIGSGGVMLPNYSPLKVAEQFAALTALAPGRVDLGLGRATGADKKASAALLGPGVAEFPAMLNLLLVWLLDLSGEQPIPDGHPASGVVARPKGGRPDPCILCSSADSATFAGAMGLPVVYADFLSPGGAGPALEAYRSAFEPSPFCAEPSAALALTALAAETGARARALDASRQAWAYEMAKGRFWPFPPEDEAKEILGMLAGDPALAEIEKRAIVGDAQSVRREVESRALACGAQEVFLLTFAPTQAARIASYRMLADAFGLTGRKAA